MNSTQQDPASGSRSEPMLSRTTILILSSFLVALAAQWISDPTLQFYVFCAGSVGVVAFIGMECRAAVLRHLAVMQESKKAASKLSDYAKQHRPIADNAAAAVRSEPVASVSEPSS